MAMTKEAAIEAIKSAPPVTVTAAVVSGYSVADAIQHLTVLYLVLQVAYLLARWRHEVRARKAVASECPAEK